MPRKEGDRPDFHQLPSDYTALKNDYPNLYATRTIDEVIAVALQTFPTRIERANRWIAHIENRLAYETAMLGEQGFAVERAKRKSASSMLPLCNYRAKTVVVANKYHRGETMDLPQIEMTGAEYAKVHTDYKGTEVCEKSHRVRVVMTSATKFRDTAGSRLAAVFLTDSKTHTKPAPAEALPIAPKIGTLRKLNPVAPVGESVPEAVAPVVQMVEKKPAPNDDVFTALKEGLKAGVQVVSAPQLFPTPPELARRVVELADIQPGMRVLEPSAGTGNLLRALPVHCESVAVEINCKLANRLVAHDEPWPHLMTTWVGKDFLETNGDLGTFDRIVMNPPFENGADIRHILHARGKLNPGGRLVAICANGPRQQEKLQPMAEEWIDLPEGSFAGQGTNVRTAICIITK